MVRGRNTEQEQYWRGVLGDQLSSGLSITAFCREREVSAASFFSWRRKLADRDRGVAHENAVEREETAAKFVPIELPSPPSAVRSCCEVVLPDGCRIIVPVRFDAGSLREILGALREQPC
jgi:transposase-like protein